MKCESLGVCLTALIQSEGAGGVQATTCREMPLCCELRAESADSFTGDEHLKKCPEELLVRHREGKNRGDKNEKTHESCFFC